MVETTNQKKINPKGGSIVVVMDDDRIGGEGSVGFYKPLSRRVVNIYFTDEVDVEMLTKRHGNKYWRVDWTIKESVVHFFRHSSIAIKNMKDILE